MTIAIIIGVVIFGFWLWRSQPIKNSHKLPQIVKLNEFDMNLPVAKAKEWNRAKLEKGHSLLLERKMGSNGFHLYITIDTNGKDLRDIKKVTISWSEWKARFYNFHYTTNDPSVKILGDQLTIDIGSFNNCAGSKNFLNRTASSTMITFDLLDYLPDIQDFEYEKDVKGQSYFNCYESWDELKKFKKGVHFIDS